ncbi:MAG: VOC family protein [Bacteroidota bacterium]
MDFKAPFKQIKETCLYVKSIDKAEAFYNRKLQFPVISKVEGRHIFFEVGSSVLLCFVASETANEKTLPPHFAEGNQHLAFEVTLESYEQKKSWVIDQDIELTHIQKWGDQYESFYFEDYESNVLEVVPEGMWSRK